MKAEDLKRLSEVFSPSDLEWRIQKSGVTNGRPYARILCYVTSRAVQNRFDEVCGPADWKNEIREVSTIHEWTDKNGNMHKDNSTAYIQGISIRVGDEWITKWDGADETNIEAVKGGISGALKRAAVLWGVGRYLYNLGDSWAQFLPEGQRGQYSWYDSETKKTYHWNPPELPDWAKPKITYVRDEEYERNKSAVLDYINSGLLSGEYAEKARSYIDVNDKEGVRKTLEWCKANS